MTRLRSAIVLLLFAVAVFASFCEAQQPPLYYSANFYTQDAAIVIRVNGFPLYALPKEGNQQTQTSMIGAFFIKGANDIVITASAMTLADGTAKPQHVFGADVSSGSAVDAITNPLLSVQRVVDLNETVANSRTECRNGAEVLAVLRTDAADGQALVHYNHAQGEVSYKQGGAAVNTIKVSLNLPQATLESLPWLAPQVVLTDADKDAVKAKVMSFHTAFAEQDWPDINTLLDTKYSRLAIAGGVAKETLTSEAQAALSQFFADNGFVLEPLVVADLVIVEFAGLNLVQVTKTGGDPIRGTGTGVNYSTRVFLSKIGNEWVIVE